MAYVTGLDRRPLFAEDGAPRAIAAWLLAVAALIFAMVVVGGATRLTGSGLSITEWQPILGAIPPLSVADWQAAFDKYRQIAQYKLVNKGMTLEAFQFIYWWEWSHRQLGRFIGLAYALPLAVFWATGRVPRGLMPTLLGLLALGGLQGFLGWYMVQSGVVTDRTSVSPYRLAMHLTLAALIFAGLIWVALDLVTRRRVRLDTLPRRAVATSRLLLWLVVAQIVLGAFVAGTQAGLSHNTWPLMDGRFVPAGLFAMSPWYLNLFENVATVQFNHRMLAYVIATLVVWHGWRCWRAADDEHVRASAVLLILAVAAQVGLGIWTLLAAVPLWLGLVHQASAMVVLAIAVWHRRAVVRDPART